ncbi:MAG: polyprenyl synthetase family protein [Marinifilaceae bacterium]|jgi:geranylgeranyl diphosphate synthase type II|nr:polyprenyl synthetase family protein [Marinifilaceae bacterium]
MHSFNELSQTIESEINKLDLDTPPVGLFEPMKYILSIGGKRLRPALVLLSANLFTEDLSKIYLPAIGMEVFHNFTLLHDDVMDNADIRRNKPTVHKKWNENVAILSGDAMSIKAYQYIVSCDDKYLREILNVFNKTAMEVCEGQQYDMEFETRTDVEIDEYLEMIRLKTAVLLAGSLKIGAILGGASPKDADLLYEFGVNMGLAFQLQDDLLDAFGDEAVFGKKIGGDIVSNKKTYLLIQALNEAKGEQRQNLLDILNEKEFDSDKKIEAVKKIYTSLEIEKITSNKINEYFNKSILLLDKVNCHKDNKSELYALVNKLLDRSV